MKSDRKYVEIVFRSKTSVLYRFRPWDPSKKMRLDESFRYLCLTPQNRLLVTILKHSSVSYSVRPARQPIPVRPVRFSLEFLFGSVGSVLILARPVSGCVVAELMLGYGNMMKRKMAYDRKLQSVLILD